MSERETGREKKDRDRDRLIDRQRHTVRLTGSERC